MKLFGKPFKPVNQGSRWVGNAKTLVTLPLKTARFKKPITVIFYENRSVLRLHKKVKDFNMRIFCSQIPCTILV